MLYRPDTDTITHHFRPVYEADQAKVWLVGCAFYVVAGGVEAVRLLWTGNSLSDMMAFAVCAALICAVMGYTRFRQAWPLVKRQAKLVSSQLTIEPLGKTRQRAKKYKDRTYFGEGYNYDPEHATDAYKIMAMSTKRRNIVVPVYLRQFVPYDPDLTEYLGGEPFLMGLGEEHPISVRDDTWRAHTLCQGLPGTGKTTALKIVALNELWREEPVLLIVIDPKNTPELKNGLEAEMKRQGKSDQFYYFSPARPTESVVVDCLANINRTTDIATRIINCIPEGGASGEVFRAFCWERVNQVAQAAHYVGERVTIMSLRYYLRREGMAKLVESCLKRYYVDNYGDEWEKNLANKFSSVPGKSLFDKMMTYYQSTLARDYAEESLSGIIDQFSKSDSDVASKTASLNALLEQLCSEPLSHLLSPNNDKVLDNDPRIVNIEEIARTGGVLYMATDGLTDPIISSSLSKLVSSAVAGASAHRYNFSQGEEPKVVFLIDEAHSALNTILLDLLAVGRQSRYQLFLCTQGLADISDKCGEDTMMRVQSLCANTISFRCEDKLTREYTSEKIGVADLVKHTKMRSNTTSTHDTMSQFTGGRGMREDSEERPLFPPHLVSALPNLQAICSFSNGEKTLVRLPVEPR
ncbi:conjugative transfer system coupling protein TraD [Vibrio sp. CB1-14]|uniref:Conjugative transfer system coupling protein TraD n=1 Tax=Vibrio chaetopteri TaxID=3016528 RepID=A0AAU8BQV7_9VIBR